jgi:tRNA(fMet)-specific endonuclease VapC
MYLLDTNHCSHFINEHPNVIDAFQSRADIVIAVSVITYGELFFMTEKSERRAENLKIVHEFLASVDLYLIDEETALIYSQLKIVIVNQFGPKDKAKRRHTRIQELGFDDNDLWIAATALQHNLTLVSSDSDFNRMQQIYSFPLETWV